MSLGDSDQVTIVPREKYPLGQTVLKVNEQRERTHMFSRRYLEEQLMTTLAGAHVLRPSAGCEELVPCATATVS